METEKAQSTGSTRLCTRSSPATTVVELTGAEEWYIVETLCEHSQEENTLKLVVPSSLRDEVLQELHAGVAGGHLGEGKTLGRLREYLYWPGCNQCQ